MDKCNLNLKKYIGTKVVEARPMNEIDAESIGYARKNNDNHEWREGYHVRYTNPDGSFYDSWSPKYVFEKAYRPAESYIDRMNIECNELAKRRDSLHDFFNTQKFKELDNIDQYLLLHQYTAMGDYLSVLKIRIERAEDKHQ